MAALALIAAISMVAAQGLRAQLPGANQANDPATEKAKAPAARARAAEPKTKGTFFSAVQLNLVIAGLGLDGCEVDVKPANPGCKFRVASSQHVPSHGRATVDLRDVELRGADHTCTIAITLRESGQAPKTIYRGFRLTTRPTPAPANSTIPSFTCYLSSRLAGVDSTRTRK
jgi:hypothetical protein